MSLPLTEAQWAEVFELCCASKSGKKLTRAEQRLVERAFKEDRERYASLEPEVFNATVPFGSTRRWSTTTKTSRR